MLQKNFFIRSLILVFAVVTLSGCLKQHAARSVPENWYRLPEMGTSSNPGSLLQMGETVDSIFDTEAASLESLTPDEDGGISKIQTAGKPADWVPWHLAGLSTDLALSADGVLGALLFSGTASVQVNWFKKPASAQPGVQSIARPNDAPSVRGLTKKAPMEARLEPAVQAALHSGAVKNESLLRSTLQKSVLEFQAFAHALSHRRFEEERFKPSAFVMEISVDANGNLVPAFSVGGAANFRLDWVLSDSEELSPLSSDQMKTAQALERFIEGISPDLRIAAREAKPVMEPSGFKLSSIRVGLGVSAEREIGIAGVHTEAKYAIVFGDNEEGDSDHPPTSSSTADLVILKPGANSEALRYADSEHINHEDEYSVSHPPYRGMRQTRFRIRHERFQAGLKKAVRMASFFVQHAARAGKGEWRIRELETEFSLSVGGTLGLSTVQGIGEVELEFENTRFMQ